MLGSLGGISATALLVAAMSVSVVSRGVRRFVEDSMRVVAATDKPAFVKVDPSRCSGCEALQPFWVQLGEQLPGMISFGNA